jgi:Flp pilus assembly protein TadD
MTGSVNAAQLNARAATLIDMGRHQAALDLLSQVVGSDPSNIRSWCLMANCHLGLSQPREAAAAARSALNLRPDFEWAMRLLALALVAIPGQEGAGLDAANRAVMLAPLSPRPHQVAAQALLALGDFPTARIAIGKAIELSPEDPELYSIAGLIELRDRRFRAARRAFLTQLRFDPNSWSAHNNLGVISARRGNRVGAARHYLRSMRVRPNQVPIRNFEATLAYFLAILLNVALVGAGLSSLVCSRSDRALAQAGADLAVVAVCALVAWRLSRTVRSALGRVSIRSLAFVGFLAGLVASAEQKKRKPGDGPPSLRQAEVIGAVTMACGLVAGFVPTSVGPALAKAAVFFATYMLFGMVFAIVKSRFRQG